MNTTPQLDGATVMQQLAKGLTSFGQGYRPQGQTQGAGTYFDQFVNNFNKAREANAGQQPQIPPNQGMMPPNQGMMQPASGQPGLIQSLIPGAMSNPWAPKTGNTQQAFGQNPFSQPQLAQPGMF